MSDAPPSPSRPTAAFPQCLSCRRLMRSLSALVRREAFSDPLVLPLWKRRPDLLLPLSAGTTPGASNTVAFKRDGAPRSRPASTRPKHNHSAAAVLIFQGWYGANKLHPFPDAAAKAQMSADTGAVSVSVIRVCAPHAFHMQHLVVAGACVSLCHAALPMLTRRRSACARACEQRESNSPFMFQKGAPKTPSKCSCCLSIIELACAFRLAGRPGRHVVCEYAQTRVEAGARLARRHTFASEGRIIPQASSP